MLLLDQMLEWFGAALGLDRLPELFDDAMRADIALALDRP